MNNDYGFSNYHHYQSPWGSCGNMQPMRPMPPLQQNMPMQTNIILVTGLEEALLKSTEKGSDMTYFRQDGDEFYRVKVDMDGRKSWMRFVYRMPDQDETAPATKADIKLLSERLAALEGKSTEVNNGESNG